MWTMTPSRKAEKIPRVSTRFSLSMENEQADAGRNGQTCLARPNSPRERGQRKYRFPLQLTTSKSMDQPSKVANPACGQLNRENKYISLISLSPFAPENLVSRDRFGSPVPRQPAHLHTQAESGAYLRDSSRVPRRRPFIYLYRQPPSGQSQVYRVTHLRTDGVHCRDSAATGPVNLYPVDPYSAENGDYT